MSRRVSWFCCDSYIITDPKVTSLPDNEHRWAYLTLLALEKQGALEGQDVTLFFHSCFVEKIRFHYILENLNKHGLIGDDFRPIEFDKWQQSALKAERNRRSYQSSLSRKSVGSQSVVSRQSANVSTSETETETDKKKNYVRADALTVLDYLNLKMGESRSSTKSIEKCIKREGCSVEDCKVVIDYKHEEWIGTDFEKFLRPDTLFSTKFPGYLDDAIAKRRVDPKKSALLEAYAEVARKQKEEEKCEKKNLF